MNPQMTFWLTVAVFVLTYLGLSLGKVPWLRIDRAGIALVGATLMMVTGIVPFNDAIQSIDFVGVGWLYLIG